MNTDPVSILMAEDDPDDRMFAEDALREARLTNELNFVGDGVDLLEYLKRQRRDSTGAIKRPGLILMDLQMPKMGGLETLRKLKSDPELRRIPVVVLTTSDDDSDVNRLYEAGASSYIVKPVTFSGLVRVMSEMGRYWFELVQLPEPGGMSP